MKLARFVLPLAVGGLLLLGTTASAQPPPTRVFVNVIADQVAVSRPNNPMFFEPFRTARVHVKLTAYDVDPGPIACAECPTADVGTLEVTKLDPNDPRPVTEFTGEINWVQVTSPGRALVNVTGQMWTFVDGGSPGNEPVGPLLPTGLNTTRDWYSSTPFPSSRSTVTGSVVGGTINID